MDVPDELNLFFTWLRHLLEYERDPVDTLIQRAMKRLRANERETLADFFNYILKSGLSNDELAEIINRNNDSHYITRNAKDFLTTAIEAASKLNSRG